jgi:Aldehyde dehydrogenase family
MSGLPMSLASPKLNRDNFDTKTVYNLHFIDNQFAPASTGETFPVIDPSTEKEFCQVAKGTKEDVARAVASSKKAFET